MLNKNLLKEDWWKQNQIIFFNSPIPHPKQGQSSPGKTGLRSALLLNGDENEYDVVSNMVPSNNSKISTLVNKI